MVKLIHLNIPRASACVMALAQKVEKAKCDSSHWLNLAIAIEGGKYLTSRDVDGLVEKYPFLNEFRL